jgi:hypothetical protein
MGTIRVELAGAVLGREKNKTGIWRKREFPDWGDWGGEGWRRLEVAGGPVRC